MLLRRCSLMRSSYRRVVVLLLLLTIKPQLAVAGRIFTVTIILGHEYRLLKYGLLKYVLQPSVLHWLVKVKCIVGSLYRCT